MKDQERPTVKLCSECLIRKDVSFFARNIKSADGFLSQCKECRKNKRKLLKITNPELYEKQLEASRAIKSRLGKQHLSESKKKWDVLNSDHVIQYRRENYLKTQDAQCLTAREYRKNNPEKHLKAVYSWMANNPDKVKLNKRVGHAKRRSVKRNAYVSWANVNAIKEIYRQASLLTKLTGISFQVDHIIPLIGKHVSGLHVENNLQILTAYDNVRKHNKFTDDVC